MSRTLKKTPVTRWVFYVVVAVLAFAIAIACLCIYRKVTASASASATERFSDGGFGFTLPIYIISLPIRKKTRLDPLLSRIHTDSRYEIVEVNAVDGRSDVVDDREPFMSPGQAGCFLSHVYFWKQIVARSEPFALVLEDDAMIRLPDMLPDLVGLVESLPERWDVLYLGGVYQPHRDGHPHTITRINDKIVKSDTFMFFSHAYVITREAAAEMLAQSEHIAEGGPDGSSSSSLRAFDSVIPVDEWMTHEDRKMNVYNTDPVFITKSDDGVSDTYDMPPPTV
jgi:GR25 family glycosyltransferase involved in LPS biosynthesis